ncbi:uroporphyrinogen-III synthase [Aeromicrobium flavum]|uniref:Uroporphyrinogen-III synthase n=1 Tax=Aeromicrobium flavum TaxID=416568 RepID=A0A512HVI8_9ACTN|nr:uroporphyrinogen-III synthase [Aeromicrobium flavum]GEO89430.1 uroporphyrinogen-III synthase [Aeromicrobium flavum]
MTPHGPVLAGTRILVTAQRRATDLASALVRRGAQVHTAATLGVEAHIDEETLVRRTQQLIDDPPDVLVVTTAIGFRSWLETAESVGLLEPLHDVLSQARIVARGPKARGAIQAAGLVADWIAESETSREMAEYLVAEGVDGQRIAVQHHGAGDDGLESAVIAAGASTVTLVVYRWGPPPDPEAVERSVRDAGAGGFDAIVFTSAPGASAWLTVVREFGELPALLELARTGRLVLAAVGPVTAEPLVVAGFQPLVPDRGRLGALVRSIVVHFGREDLGVDVVGGRLRVHGTAATLDHEVLALSPAALAVLRLLASEPGAVFTRDQVLAVLPRATADPHAADVAVGRLREALGDRELVKTVVKRGFRLAPLEREELSWSSVR